MAEALSVRISPDRSASGSPGESSPGPGSTTSHFPVVAGQSMVPRFNIPSRRASSGAPRQEGPSVPSRGLVISPPTRTVETVGLEKWKVFTSWCSDHQLDPVNCPVGTVLEFLQDRFTARLAPSTLKFYVAVISAYHIPLGGMLLGKTPWYLVFLNGTLRLRCCKPSVLLLSECVPGKAQFALPSAGIRCLRPQSCPVV